MLFHFALTRGALPRHAFELILKYYSGGEKNKINRQALAKQFGIGANALRLRVFRIRKAIKNYILQANTNTLMAGKQS
jgi:hypothetical protein